MSEKRRRLLEDGPLRRMLRARKEGTPEKEVAPQKTEEPLKSGAHETLVDYEAVKPETGKTYPEQSNEAYCLECIEGHTMMSLTETRHAIDRFRTAGKMTPGVTEKVRGAIEEISGIVKDVKDTKDASPEVKEGLEQILEEVRWIRKEFGISGRGLTRGKGDMTDLEELRGRITKMNLKAYELVEKCPTCKVLSRDLRHGIVNQ